MTDAPCAAIIALRGAGDSKQVRHPQGAQFTVAPPQHFLYFFPEPQAHVAPPDLGSGAPWFNCVGTRTDLPMRPEIAICPKSPAAMCTMTSSRFSGMIGLGRISGLRRARGRASSSGSGIHRAPRARTPEDHDVHVGALPEAAASLER